MYIKISLTIVQGIKKTLGGKRFLHYAGMQRGGREVRNDEKLVLLESKVSISMAASQIVSNQLPMQR
jgi:hypothetical protein